ncbi:hypothetical protein TPHA_0H02310 [Tetrapisispora phaffii CBS 4417]|uniref:Ubiquitin-like modifier HUB1 n=1 Tax=Tetrapisispora phaffii (strain ATCC 24235 / CBS 4417 / NBRC 1672 / NRRL Y-8282 / UCD 70-5) TaxID=1071381 RepID=G8BWI4_TETPH|nr:hypothetical protein TPHA_0H02310 [Tetrapisispora phaffii CBS 4417]CCE64435.1 hypothetical protein TPHA_0H02310 [Tetrapisispora phaffii CBS 4417]
MIEIIVDDRLSKKIKVKCLEDDTIEDLKKLICVQLGLSSINKIDLQKNNIKLKNHITLDDYEIHSMTSLDLYYI